VRVTNACSNLTILNETTQTVVCVVSSFSYLTLLSPAIIAISAFIAYLGLRSAREIARKKATLDLIEKVESTPHYRDLQANFRYYAETKEFARLHTPMGEKDRMDRTAVQDYLNHYELVSIGIENKILDEEFYKKWMATPFVRDWNAASDFVQRERWKQNPTTAEWEYFPKLYETYQRVALRFNKAANKLNAKYAPHPDTAEGPGDKPPLT
jgi:hypothetical protein